MPYVRLRLRQMKDATFVSTNENVENKGTKDCIEFWREKEYDWYL